MKLTCPKPALLTALSTAVTVAERNSAAYVNACVLIDASGPDLMLSATDGIASVRSAVTGARIEKPGAFGVNAKDALERVRAMPDGDVTIEEKGPAIVIRSGKRKHTVRAFTAAEFPAFPTSSGGAGFTCNGARLAWLIGRVLHCARLDSTTPEQHAVRLWAEGDELHADATDGLQMALADVTLAEPVKLDALLALKSAGVVARLCENVEGDVSVCVDGSRLFVTAHPIQYGTLLVSANAPPLRHFLSQIKADSTVDVPRALFLDALKSVAIAAGDKARSVTLKVDGDELAMSSTGDGTDGEDRVPCTFEGEVPVRSFPTAQMIAALGVIEAATVRLSVSGAKPMTITAVDGQPGQRVVVAMAPMMADVAKEQAAK